MPQVKGEPSKMDWKSYVARRRLDVSAWITARGFKSYSEIQAWCKAHDLEAPLLREVKAHLPRVMKKKVVAHAQPIEEVPLPQVDAAPKKRKRKSSNE